MRVFKLGAISIVIFGVLLILLSLLIPSNIRVSRAINIHGNGIDTVITDLGSWPAWNTLYNDSVKVSILSADSSDIQTLWTSRNSAIQGNFHIVHSAGVSVVQWYFEFRLKWYPWEKLGSIIFDKQLGPPWNNL